MHFYFILASCPSVTSSYQRPPIQSRPPLMELFVFLRYGPLEPCLKSSAIPSVLFRLYRSAIFAPPSRELDSVPLRLDPTCHQDASLRIRPIQCVRLSAVWFCFLLLGFLRYAPLSPSAHPRTCCFSKCPRVAATNINGGLRLGEGRPHFSLLLFRLYSPILFTV